MISLMCWYIERDLDEEKREEFRNALNRDDSYVRPKRHLKSISKTSDISDFKPNSKNKWKAPPGWKPPGWNEEKSYKTAMSFMAFQRNPQ